MPRPTKPELLAEYSRLLVEQPSRAYAFGVVRRLRSKDMAAASERVKILQATEFRVVFFRGRDPREDRGVVRGSLYEVVEGLPTLQAARAVVASAPPDPHGRRPLVRAITGACPMGITVPEDFELC